MRGWRMRLRSGCLLLVSLCTCSLAVAQDLEPVVLQLKWRHAFQFAGYYAALEQGYYKEAGLDVEIRELTGDKSPGQMLLDGEADFAVAGAELLIHRAQGDPLVALAAIFQHSPYAFLVREDSGMTRVENFVGKRVMLGSGTQDAELQATLRRAGLREDDYQRQVTSYDAMSLLNRDTDVFNAYVTDQGFTLQEAGLRTRYILPQRYGVDFYSDVLATTEAQIREHPAQVEAFRAATLRGWEYALANPDELIKLILERYNTQGFSYARLEYEARISREMIQPLLVSIGYMNPERWEHMRRIFAEEGFVDGDSNIDGLIYSEAPEEQALQQLNQVNLVDLGLGLAGFLLLALVGGQFYLRRAISERAGALAAQEEVKNRPKHLVSLLQSLDGINWEFDLSLQQFTYVSPGIQRLLGYRRDAWQTLDDWLDTVVSEDREYARRYRLYEVDAGRDYICEYRLEKRSGVVMWVMDAVRLIRDENGKPVALTGFIVNIDEFKRAQQAQRDPKERRHEATGMQWR